MTLPIYINNSDVEIVRDFKFLGTIISEDLKFEKNIDSIVKKAHKRLFFLRQLKKFHLSPRLLSNFYRAAIESIATFSITVWYGNCDKESRKKIEKIIETCEKISNTNLPSLENVFNERTNKKAKRILDDRGHPANYPFELLPSK